jgi:ABC-2 type transport system permease protein
MNAQSNPLPESFASRDNAPAVLPATQLMYWSVRRELWENRSIYLAPLAAAGLFVFGFLISLTHLPAKMRGAAPDLQRAMVEQSYVQATLLIMGTTIIVAIFYCLDALYGERRDRSILFWKSLPVSDLITVLSKAIVPIFILPVVSFAITVAVWLIMLVLSSAVLM